MSVVNPSWESLTVRQKQVLLGILDRGQLLQKEVAFAMGISLKTLASHKSAAFLKLGLKTDIDLARFAIRNGIIEA